MELFILGIILAGFSLWVGLMGLVNYEGGGTLFGGVLGMVGGMLLIFSQNPNGTISEQVTINYNSGEVETMPRSSIDILNGFVSIEDADGVTWVPICEIKNVEIKEIK